MLFSRKYSLTESGVLKGATDIHSHILWGVDDGIKQCDDSLAALKAMFDLGISEIYLTPHIMEDVPNTTEGLRKRFDELVALIREDGCCNEFAGHKVENHLHLAAEYMLDGLFFERLAKKDLLLFPNNIVLVEASTVCPPMDFIGNIALIKSKGCWPMLAHPERYPYLRESDYRKLYDMGTIFQLNTPSICGFYGSKVQKTAKWLLKNGMYKAIGSDTHRFRQIAAVTSAKELGAKEVEALKAISKGLIF